MQCRIRFMNKSIRRGIEQSMTTFKDYFLQIGQAFKRFLVFIINKVTYHTSWWVVKWTVVIGLVVLLFPLLIPTFFMDNPVPTHIRADFTVNRFAFMVNDRVELKSIQFESMDVRKFARIEMNPTQLAVKEADSTWRPLKLTELPLVITPVPGMLSEATIIVGKLENFSINPGTKVILETQENSPQRLTITMSNLIYSQPISLLYSNEKPFELRTKHGQVSSIELPRQNEMTFKATLPDPSNPYIEILSQPNALELSLVVKDEGRPFSIFSNNVIPVTNLELVWTDRDRKEHTSLMEEGEISYVGYSEKKDVSLKVKDTDFIKFGESDELQIEKAIFDPTHPSIKLRVQGVVSEATLRPSLTFPKQDLRLTRYDKLLEEVKVVKIIIENREWIILALISIIGIILIEDFKKLVKKLAKEGRGGEG